ncbi:MAG: peptidase [Candidatus Latescibacterota bacterium]|nr:MAG: peptidase [Candidatus Latescibacterota bacterium]
MLNHRRLLDWICVAAILIIAQRVHATETIRFEDYFADGALRIDLVHSGTASSEEMSVRRIVREEIWAGPKVNLIPHWDMGKYRLDVRDDSSGTLIFRSGFSSLFAEWRTTAEANLVRRGFEETLELPFPRGRVELDVSVRNKTGEFERLLTVSIDPESHVIGKTPNAGGVDIHELVVNGPPERMVDLLVLGDGYTVIEREKFRRDCRHLMDRFFDAEPFASYRDRFNVRAIHVASPESGVDEPRKRLYRDTPFDMQFNTFDSPRYCMTESVWAIHDAAAHAPHDAILLIGNSSRYGGGAIYNFYTAFASDNEYDDYLCVHEFGHGFAGLGDEYYSSAVSYNELYPRDVEPWEPNITALLDEGKLKWGSLVDADTPIPTPEDDPRYADKVGAFEGAGYSAKGLYRPAKDCKMFSKGNRRFCPVCERAVVRMIEFYSPE